MISRICFVSCLILLSFSKAFATDYVFGVVPQQAANQLVKSWMPILTYLSERTGDTYRFATASDIPTFEKRLAGGEYDFAYMNPYHYTVFSQTPGYVAFAKQKDKKIIGLMVANKSSQINTIEDLQGLEVAFPSPAAFAASILPRAELKKKGILITPRYVSSHDSVYLNVSRGFFAAGGGIKRTLNNVDENISDSLRILWTSKPYTPHAFAAKSSINQQVVLSLQKAMLEMEADEQGLALLQKIGFQGIESAVDADWDDVRSLEIQTLSDMLQ